MINYIKFCIGPKKTFSTKPWVPTQFRIYQIKNSLNTILIYNMYFSIKTTMVPK